MSRQPGAREGLRTREAASAGSSAGVVGRLARPPHPLLHELLYEPQLRGDREAVLPHLLAVDAAHLVMLGRQGLLPAAVAAQLLSANADLEARRAAGEDLFGAPREHRGLYFLYEGELVARLGPEVGGAGHLGRSRNDIQATVARLRLRVELLALLAGFDRLLAAAAALARRHAETLMSGFTHLQPAQPTSFGHYLAAVASELLRAADALSRSYAAVDLSPMGAAAGFGSELPVDRGLVADLLGFAGVVPNSLDAVASRDYAIEVLAGLARAGVTLTRLATDLQTWASAAYGFLGWPDELVSTSSIMPQKRNAFVLENVRGEAVAPAAALAGALLGMKNVPFTNSIEAGAEATAHLWPALVQLDRALRLAALLLEEVEVHPQRMRRFLAGRQTAMTALADHLAVRHGLAFRTAHEAVARLAQELGEEEPPPAEVARRLAAIFADSGVEAVALGEDELARALDPAQVLAAALHGGGPAPESVRAQVEQLEVGRARLAEENAARRRSLAAAAERRREEAARWLEVPGRTAGGGAP